MYRTVVDEAQFFINQYPLLTKGNNAKIKLNNNQSHVWLKQQTQRKNSSIKGI